MPTAVKPAASVAVIVTSCDWAGPSAASNHQLHVPSALRGTRAERGRERDDVASVNVGNGAGVGRGRPFVHRHVAVPMTNVGASFIGVTVIVTSTALPSAAPSWGLKTKRSVPW